MLIAGKRAGKKVYSVQKVLHDYMALNSAALQGNHWARLGVNWVAVEGGSMVLTQAMKMLVDQGVVLDTHGVFLMTQPARPMRRSSWRTNSR
jgi:hypothetical protein